MEEPKQAVHLRNPTNITEFKWFCTKEWAQTPTCYCAGLISIYKKTLPSVTAANGSHTRYWKQRFTNFCSAQICNTGYIFSVNKWQRKYFSLTCLIRFSLSTFRTYVTYDVMGHINLKKIIKGSQTSKQHCTVYIYIYIYIYIYRPELHFILMRCLYLCTNIINVNMFNF